MKTSNKQNLTVVFMMITALFFLPACEDDSGGGGNPIIGKNDARERKKDARESIDERIDEAIEESLAGPVASTIPEPSNEVTPAYPDSVGSAGGQVLVQYLNDEVPAEEVVVWTLQEPDMVETNLAEMSMAVKQLKQEGRYGVREHEKVLVLEGAIMQTVNDLDEDKKDTERKFEYGLAVVAGVVGGVFADDVIRGTRQALDKAEVWDKAATAKLRDYYQRTLGKESRIGKFFARKPRAERAPRGDGFFSRIRRGSSTAYARAAQTLRSGAAALTPEEEVMRNITRVLGPELAKGFRAVRLSGNELTTAKRLLYYKTGLERFRINQRKGADFFTVKLTRPDGDHYFKVAGAGIKAATENGEKQVFSAPKMTETATSRLRNFGEETLTFATESGRKIRTGISQSKAAQLSKAWFSNPKVQNSLKRTAVGGTVGLMTLMAIKPVDWRYFVLEDYVEEIAEEGVVLDEERGAILANE